MNPIRFRAVCAAAVAAAFVALATGCASKEEKLENHMARANEHLAKGEPKVALLELRSALQLAPNNGAVNMRIAEVMAQEGMAADAAFFYREAFRVDPSLDEARLGAAQYLATSDPEAADALVQEVLTRDPSSARAHSALANLALVRLDPEGALKPALVATNLAPEDPEVHLQLGRVYQAQIQVRDSKGEVADDKVFQGGVAAFDAAERAAKDDEYVANSAAFERARVLAAWPNHTADAERAYLDLIDRTQKSNDPKAIDSARRVALRFASLTRDGAVYRRIIEKVLSVDSSYLPAWIGLASLEEKEGRSADAIYDRLLGEQPRNPSAHVARADYLQKHARNEEAVAVLREAAGKVDGPEIVQAALVEMLYQMGRDADAAKIVDEMERAKPDTIETRIASATRAMREHRYREAGDSLTPLAEEAAQPRVFRMLAESKLRTGEYELALRAIERGLEVAGPGWIPGRTMRFVIQRAMGDWQGALQTLADLQKSGVNLSDEQLVMAAEAFYETGDPHRGRAVLDHVLAKPTPPITARVIFARKEGPGSPARARAVLEEGLKQTPGERSLIQELAIVEGMSGDIKSAVARLDGLIASTPANDPAPGLRALRGRMRIQGGDAAGGEEDLIAALRAAPGQPGIAEMVGTMATSQKRVPETIAVFEEIQRGGTLPPPARRALAQLYIAADRDTDALALLEELLKTTNDPVTKNDVAYLLAKSGGDRERALSLAQEAVSASGASPSFADTLGYVYLQKEMFAPALQQFERAVELAEATGQPRPEFHYRRGVALEKLGRKDDARRAFDAALSLDPGFADAQKARAALGESGGETPSQSS
jgi:tetratricopeptide (TPR) repeat protein